MREQVRQAAEALGKLVACKDTELRLRRLHESGHGTDYDQHRKQFAAAWDQARATIAALTEALAAPQVPAEKLYVAAHECHNCSHVGINDSHPTDAACNTCDWSGPSPEEDHCPGCGCDGTMTSACPKCSSRYYLLAETHLAAAPQVPEVQVHEVIVDALRHRQQPGRPPQGNMTGEFPGRPTAAAPAGVPSDALLDQVLDALRLGRLSLEWSDKADDAGKMGAAMDAARQLAARASSPAPLPVPADELCRFPDCKCPMDPGPEPDWCARGLPAGSPAVPTGEGNADSGADKANLVSDSVGDDLQTARPESRVKVYIASPYTKGDVAVNVKRQLNMADELMTLGYAPFAPLYSHFQHMAHPRPYTDWIALDLEWVPACDVVLRLEGESSGADGEVAFAKERAIPVVYSVTELQQRFPVKPNQSAPTKNDSCTCACCVELTAMLAHPDTDHNYRKACHCAFYPENERCDCAFCSAQTENCARAA